MIANRAPLLASAVFISMALLAGPVHADVSADADAAFKQGQDLLAEKKIDAACAAFERSEKLEPRGGTLLSLAYCHEQQSRNALAYTEYDEALRRLRVGGGRQDREKFAGERMAALKDKVVMLTAEFSEPVRALNPDVVVIPSKAGDAERKLAPAAARVQIPLDVDGGAYRVEVRAVDRKPYVAQIQVAANAATPPAFTVTELEPIPGSAADVKPEKDGTTQRTIGMVIGGVGLAFAVAGGVFGVLALQCASDHRSNGDDAAGGCDRSKAKVFYANGANIGLGLGAAGILGGGYLYLTAPKGRGAPPPTVGVSPAVLPGGGGMAVSGRF